MPYTIVIDAGHGGNDPGKIGVDDSREKDLNLVIADKVKRILEQQDIDVIMTRETDTGLYEEDASNKKVQDLKKRVSIMVFIMFFRERLLQVLEKARTISVLKN